MCTYLNVTPFLSHFCVRQLIHSIDPDVSSRYAAHADREFLVLLDTTPSQEMLHEGLAREIINKIQKLRKKVSNGMAEKLRERVCTLLAITATEEYGTVSTILLLK